MKIIKKKIKTIKPFFSIITVVKNDQKNILKTVKSISNQTFKNFEYIVVDGASTDKTIQKIKNNKMINLLLSGKDKGIYDAMNIGLKKSIGKVILFVNSGDILTKNALKIVNDKFKKNTKLSFIFGTVLRHYTKSSILKHGYNFDKIVYNFDFATSHTTGFFLKRSIYKKIGYYDINFKCSADYDLYLRLYQTKVAGSYTKKNELIGIVKSGGFSSKISFISHLIEETKIRIKNRQNFLFVIIIFINAWIKYLFKKLT